MEMKWNFLKIGIIEFGFKKDKELIIMNANVEDVLEHLEY